jgi:hypothetical protein
MKTKFQNIRPEHDQLQFLFEGLKAEANSRFSKYDPFQKLHTSSMKQIESDVENFHDHQEKINSEIKRVSKACANVNKQKTPVKTYASVVVPANQTGRNSNSHVSIGRRQQFYQTL